MTHIPMHRPTRPPPDRETVSEKVDYYVTGDRVAVDPDYHWRPMDTCPIGVKVQLLTKGGIATHGRLGHTLGSSSPHEYQGWTPVPKKVKP